ncbi:MAG: YkgJ family cysteine cluster protein [Hyphomicrobium sp.]|nr:YkgJ family cysteine cluster protein [Hyphomicrobium sp.]MBN9268243.1 YkgJ family cysteine cluster protein [Hyphomicrobium sp.]
MSEVSRQQRRREIRERIKKGHQLLGQGLPLQPRASEIVAVAQVVRAKLEEAGNARRAGEAAEIAQSLAERSLAARPATKQQIACKRGCSYCCYSFVAITPPEAFRLAAAVRSGEAGGMSVDAVRERARPLIGVSPKDRIGGKLACPLLVDGACSVYRFRPLVCRQATSLDVAVCLDEFEGRNLNARIPISGVHMQHAGSAHITLLGAMRAVGFSTDALELGAALDAALSEPDAEARWLQGEDVFGQVPRQVTREIQLEHAITHVASALAA